MQENDEDKIRSKLLQFASDLQHVGGGGTGDGRVLHHHLRRLGNSVDKILCSLSAGEGELPSLLLQMDQPLVDTIHSQGFTSKCTLLLIFSETIVWCDPGTRGG